MEGKININIDAALQLAKERKAKDVISSAMNAFKITKKNYLQRGILIVIILIIATVVGYTRETVNIFSESCETILNVVVAMFGTVFTGYSFFQALISEELLVRMVNDTTKDCKGDEKSKLQETNETFIECMMLELFTILISLLLKIIISCVNPEFLLFNQMWKNTTMASILIFVYFYIVAIVLWEIKSFIFNVFQLFNIYAGVKIVGIVKKE